MVRLSKKVEYGIIAMKHIAASSRHGIVTAKEIAAEYNIPFEVLAKVMQKLAKAGLILSHQGVHGGYALAKHPNEVAISTIIHAVEGSTPMIAQCMTDGPESCCVFDVCTIKQPLYKVQANIELVFQTMMLSQIV
ncbi:MAG TPA: Rrf2 family transcriptional regulator [Bacteroidota bacterium]|jgi:Rrf2 family protein